MSLRYIGGRLSATAATATTTSAQGVWSMESALQNIAASTWPRSPSAPTIGTATAGNAQATVTFTPNSIGSAPIIYYQAISSPGGITGNAISSPITVTGLSNGTAYTFTVIANTGAGTSPASAATNSVTPSYTPAAIISSSTASHGSTTDITITKPTSVSSGNLLVACIIASDLGAAQKYATAPSGWTYMSNASTNSASAQMYYKTATGSEPADYTWSGLPIARSGSGCIINFNSNTAFNSNTEALKFQSSPSVTLVTSALSSPSADSILIFLGGSEDSGKTMAAPSGFSTLHSNIGGSGQAGSAWIFYKTVGAGSTGSPSTTLATTGQGYVQMALVKTV